MKNKILITALVLLSSSSLFSQELVSKTFLGTVTSSEIKNQAGSYPFIQHDVDCYKITYTSVDAKNNPDTLSGLLIVPETEGDFPYLIYAHGTVDCKNCVPSAFQNDGDVGAGLLMSSAGYIAILPDYVGMGEGRGFQTYVHYETSASAIEDMFLAVKSEDLTSSNMLFVSGYSQGGYASMAFQKKMSDKGNIEITAASHMSGPYNISGAMRDMILSEQSYSYVAYVPNTILGYNEVYNFYNDLNEVFKPQYVEDIRDYYEDKITLTTLNTRLIQKLILENGAPIPHYVLEDGFYNEVKSKPNNILNQLLEQNNVYDFKPEIPTRIFYCQGDDQVPFVNSTSALDSMLSYGADASLVKSQDVKSDANHAGCIVPAFTQTLLFFASEQLAYSTKEISAGKINLYPNPADNILRISADNFDVSLIEIYDLQGRLEKVYNAVNENEILDLSNINDGFYFVKIYNFDGSVITQKLLINHN